MNWLRHCLLHCTCRLDKCEILMILRIVVMMITMMTIIVTMIIIILSLFYCTHFNIVRFFHLLPPLLLHFPRNLLVLHFPVLHFPPSDIRRLLVLHFPVLHFQRISRRHHHHHHTHCPDQLCSLLLSSWSCSWLGPCRHPGIVCGVPWQRQTARLHRSAMIHEWQSSRI